MATERALADRVAGEPEHVEIHVCAHQADDSGPWKVVWEVTATDDLRELVQGPHLQERGRRLTGLEFIASDIPVPPDEWSGSPLAGFLGSVCQKIVSSGRHISLVVNDLSKEDIQRAPGPVVLWNQAPIQLNEQSESKLGMLVPSVCRAKGPRDDCMREDLAVDCCILLGRL